MRRAQAQAGISHSSSGVIEHFSNDSIYIYKRARAVISCNFVIYVRYVCLCARFVRGVNERSYGHDARRGL